MYRQFPGTLLYNVSTLAQCLEKYTLYICVCVCVLLELSFNIILF